jgi:hypothetical protein
LARRERERELQRFQYILLSNQVEVSLYI